MLPSLPHTVCVCVCVAAISMAVAAGHGKSSMLPLIVLISSLGAASPHTLWPLPLLWNRALLTRRRGHWAHACMTGGGGRASSEKLPSVDAPDTYKYRQNSQLYHYKPSHN